jgi:hypothetical protein
LQDSNDNTHLNTEEIAENNIDEGIKNIGRRWGMDIEKKCVKLVVRSEATS